MPLSQTETDAAAAMLIAVADHRLQKYMQTYPFLDGPDEALNLECFREIRSHFRARALEAPVEAISLGLEQTTLGSEVLSRLREMLQQIGISAEEQGKLIQKLAWKVRDVPAAARRILVLGHGGGYELLFLRAVAPQAEIYTIDWVDATDPKIRELVKPKIAFGNFWNEIKAAKGGFDVFF